jgi:hypothetical protein
MAGLDPAIHGRSGVDPRDKPGDDDKKGRGAGRSNDRAYRFSNTSLAICAAVIAAGQPA